MSNKNLLYIFLGLALIFALTQLFNTKKDRSFKSELLKIDTSTVTKILIQSQSDQHKLTTLTRSGVSSWTAAQGAKTVPAIAGSVDAILRELVLMKVKSIATQSKDRYNEYEISDSIGSHIEVFAGDKKLTDFYTGKFGFVQQTNSMLSYIRMKDDPSVYTIDGFQSMSFNAAFASFRDKTISALSTDPIEKVGIVSNGIKNELLKSGQAWLLNGLTLIDSTAIQNYINSLQSLNGSELLDEWKASNPIHSASLVAGSKSTNLDLYASGDSLRPFIIHSSANPDVYFKEDSSGVYRTVFTGMLNLVKVPPSTPKKK